MLFIVLIPLPVLREELEASITIPCSQHCLFGFSLAIEMYMELYLIEVAVHLSGLPKYLVATD